MTDQELELACDRVMQAISDLSNAARTAKEERLTRLSSDLYYAANRAWLELDGMCRRQRIGGRAA